MRIAFVLFTLFLSLSSFAQHTDKLHRKAIVIDTHNDLLSSVILEGKKMEDDLTGIAHSDLKRFKDGGIDIQIFSVFCDERYGKGTAFAFANREIDSLMNLINRHPDKLRLVRNPWELRASVKEKKLGCMIGVEGGHMIESRMDYLDSLYNRGTRYMTLTWNNSTDWASSAADETQGTVPNPSAGLNDLGRQVVKRMNTLGMLVDVSHLGEKSFWDLMSIAEKPVIASHSNAYTLCPVRRNLKDDQIRAIGKNGGVIHLNFYSGFVDSSFETNQKKILQNHQAEADSLTKAGKPYYDVETSILAKYKNESDAVRPSLGQLLDHLDYIVKLIGVDHVGLGSDFDGISSSPKNLNGVEDFPNITQALKKRGYSKKDIKKILGGNFIRVFEANYPK